MDLLPRVGGEERQKARRMKIFAIYASISDDDPIVRTLADCPVEALETVRRNAWVAQQLTGSAYAERVEEVVEI